MIITLLTISALGGIFTVLFLISPIYGIAFVTAFRTLFLLVNIPLGKYDYSAEGFLTLLLIAAGVLFMLQQKQRSFDGFLKWPFVIFILYCGLTFAVADDYANFFKKFARLIGYFSLYLMTVRLCMIEKNRKLLGYAFVAAIIITSLPAVYIYYINPQKYVKEVYSEYGSTLAEVGFMPKNNFGFFTCYMVYFLLYMYSTVRSLTAKIGMLGMVVLQAVLLVMSFTRAAWIGFVMAFPALIFASKNKMKLLMPFLAIIVVGASLYSFIYYGSYRDLTEKKQYGFNSWHYRVAYAWPASIKAFEQRPVMGWGLGNDLYALSQAARFNNTSHNDYLLVSVETGSIGIALYLWLLAALFGRTASGVRSAEDSAVRSLNAAALATLIAYLVGSMAEHLLQTPGSTGYVITVLAMAHGASLGLGREKESLRDEEFSAQPAAA